MMRTIKQTLRLKRELDTAQLMTSAAKQFCASIKRGKYKEVANDARN